MVEKGTIVKVEFDAWTEEGELFDTTHKDVAKEAGKVNENVAYEPMPAIVGVGRLVPGFDKALLETPVGEEKEIRVPPEEAFGEKDPAKVETVSMREFQKQEVHPHPGMRLNVSGRPGTVVSVTAGRVRVDFNPPFAGKALKYKFKIVEEVADPAERVKALIDMDYGQGKAQDFEVSARDGEAEIKLPDACKYDQRWFVAKYRLVSDLRAYAEVKTTRFIEEYTSEPFQASEAHDHEHDHEPAQAPAPEP